MPRPKKSEIDAYKNEVLAMYEDDLSIIKISRMLAEHGLDISSSTIKRRLMDWAPARHPRIGEEEQMIIKSRIHTLVHEEFCNDQEILATLRAEGHSIRSLYKVRELRRQAGIPRWRPKDDAEYKAWLVNTVREKLTREEIQNKGVKQMYASLRSQGICVPKHRLLDVLNEIDPETAAQRRKHMPKGQGLRSAKKRAAAAAAAQNQNVTLAQAEEEYVPQQYSVAQQSPSAGIGHAFPYDNSTSTTDAFASWPSSNERAVQRTLAETQTRTPAQTKFNMAFAQAIIKTLRLSPAFDPTTIGEQDLVTMLDTGMALDDFADTIQNLQIGMTANIVKLQHKALWSKMGT